MENIQVPVTYYKFTFSRKNNVKKININSNGKNTWSKSTGPKSNPAKC